MDKVTKKKLVAALEAVAGEVLNQDELGGCVWCGGSGKEGAYGYCDETYDCHQADCAWVTANKLLTAYREA